MNIFSILNMVNKFIYAKVAQSQLIIPDLEDLKPFTADKDGYVTLYTNGPKGHLEYIEKLAQKLEIPLMTHFAVSNIKENN